VAGCQFAAVVVAVAAVVEDHNGSRHRDICVVVGTCETRFASDELQAEDKRKKFDGNPVSYRDHRIHLILSRFENFELTRSGSDLQKNV